MPLQFPVPGFLWYGAVVVLLRVTIISMMTSLCRAEFMNLYLFKLISITCCPFESCKSCIMAYCGSTLLIRKNYTLVIISHRRIFFINIQMSIKEKSLYKDEIIESHSSGKGSLGLNGDEGSNRVANRIMDFESEEDALEHAEIIIQITGLFDKGDFLRKGALAVSFPGTDSEKYPLSAQEKLSIEEYDLHPWKQPIKLYLLAIISALSAAVQGMDESAVGGAQLFYIHQFYIDGESSYDANVQGIINSIPYLSASIVGCWVSIPMNALFGRRICIFIASFFAAASGLWQAFSPSWQMLLVGRLIMGITIGIKSATVPVYTAESTPGKIRGSLVMLWQVFTAFGVMLGSVMGIAFLKTGKNNWRYMLGSVFPLPLVVCLFIFFSPESPRWLIAKKKYRDSYNSFLKLRLDELLAARDFYYAVSLIEIENHSSRGYTWFSKFLKLFSVPRNRSAVLASCILMFGQQFCGVNVLTFYISSVLVGAGFSNHDSLAGACGFGALAVCGALTAIPIIDKRGRRFLVLFTFPLLAVFLFWSAFSFLANNQKTKLGLVLVGLYLHVFFYGVGSGPVPFTYNAESAALAVRDVHASLGTATTWMACFILGFTLPHMKNSIKNEGVFCFYAAWCIVLFVLIFLFVPETKGYTLEELDLIFETPIAKHASFQIKLLRSFISRLFKKDISSQKSFLEYALSLQEIEKKANEKAT